VIIFHGIPDFLKFKLSCKYGVIYGHTIQHYSPGGSSICVAIQKS